jgi:SOS-response transcriptional repressor LexA
MREQVIADLAEESLARAGTLTLRVQGASMLPAIRPGSYVKIRQAALNEVQPGHIVLVRAARGFRLHRLVEIRAGWLITKGDNHTENDPPEPLEHFLGVCTRS